MRCWSCCGGDAGGSCGAAAGERGGVDAESLGVKSVVEGETTREVKLEGIRAAVNKAVTRK